MVVKDLSEIEAHRAAWDRRAVVYEGVWTNAFETSWLDEKIWLTRARDVSGSGAAVS